MRETKRAVLILADGTKFEGKSFGYEASASGEVVFNTAMTGYPESLTDPSYEGQILVTTFPLLGNYGVPPADSRDFLSDYLEDSHIHCRAIIAQDYSWQHSHWLADRSLSDWLKSEKITGIYDIDTRALTIQLRSKGSMRCMISTRDLDPESLTAKARALPGMEGQNLVPFVAAKAPYVFLRNAVQTVSADKNGRLPFVGSGLRLVVYDYGIKWNIIRLLKETGFSPVMVPPLFPAEAVRRSGAQGVFLSNGPGDPATLTGEIAIVRDLMKDFPVAGICLGHQIIGHALGGTTSKLKFGHHGCNHPVRDNATGHVEISSQNHGFCVCVDGVKDVEVTHINLNDGTLEGIRSTTKPVMSVQYHPEAAAGPHDSRYLFARFHKMMEDAVKK